MHELARNTWIIAQREFASLLRHAARDAYSSSSSWR